MSFWIRETLHMSMPTRKGEGNGRSGIEGMPKEEKSY